MHTKDGYYRRNGYGIANSNSVGPDQTAPV